MKKIFTILFFGIMVSIQAEVKSVEHFEYPDGESIYDNDVMNGGIGFADKWTSSSTLAAVVDFAIRDSNLTYTNLKSQGNALKSFRTNTNSGNYYKELYRKFSFAPIDITESNFMYMCFIFNIDNIGSNTILFKYTGKNSSDSDINLNFNIPSISGGSSVKVQGTDRSPDYDHTISGITSGNNLMLVRASKDSSANNPETNVYNKVDFWLNPDLSDLGSPDVTEYYCVSMFHSDGINRTPDQLLFYVKLDESSFLFDEFYITDSLDDIRNAFGSICIFK